MHRVSSCLHLQFQSTSTPDPSFTRIARKASAFRAGMESAANGVRLLFSYTGYVGYRDYATDGRSLFGNSRYAVVFGRRRRKT